MTSPQPYALASPVALPVGQPVDVPWSVLPDYRCFGCSPHNPHGLQLTFRTHPDGLAAQFRFGREHESYPGVVHGGLAGVVCDETMGNLIVLRAGLPAFTVSLRLVYLAPLVVDTPYTCIARLRPGQTSPDGASSDGVSSDGASRGSASPGLAEQVRAAAEIVAADGELAATATGSYRPATLDWGRQHIRLSDHEAAQLQHAFASQTSPSPHQP